MPLGVHPERSRARPCSVFTVGICGEDLGRVREMWIRLVALVVEELLVPVGVAVIIVLGVADLTGQIDPPEPVYGAG